MGILLSNILVLSNIAVSKREAKELISNGAIYVNGDKVISDITLTINNLLHDRYLAIRKGKKDWKLIEFLSNIKDNKE